MNTLKFLFNTHEHQSNTHEIGVNAEEHQVKISHQNTLSHQLDTKELQINTFEHHVNSNSLQQHESEDACSCRKNASAVTVNYNKFMQVMPYLGWPIAAGLLAYILYKK